MPAQSLWPELPKPPLHPKSPINFDGEKKNKNLIG